MMESIDPYSTSPVRDPRAAAIALGRSIARVHFHFSQWVLSVPDEESQPGSPDQELGLTTNEEHLEAALISIAARGVAISSNVLGPVQRCIDEIRHFNFREQCYDAVARAESVLNSGSRDDHCDHFRQEIVEDLVLPWCRRFSEAIERAVGAEVTPFYRLGRAIDQGVCRHDVYRFLDKARSVWPVIGRPQLPEPAICENFDWAAPPLMSRRPTTLVANKLTSCSRAPGDLAPPHTWSFEVEQAWRQAGLDATRLQVLRDFETHFRAHDLMPTTLIHYVDDFFREVCAQIGLRDCRLSIEFPTVTGRPCCAILARERYAITLEQAWLFKELLNGISSFKKIKALHPDVFGSNQKLRRLIERLPRELRNIVESGKGKKTRLLL